MSGVAMRALAVTGGCLLAAASPAAATFPGANGRIVVEADGGSRAGGHWSELRLLAPRPGGAVEVMPLCGTDPTRTSFCDVTGPVAVAPDGRRAAVVTGRGVYSGRPNDNLLRIVDLAARTQVLADIEDPLAYSYGAETGRLLRWGPSGDRLAIELAVSGVPYEEPTAPFGLGLDGSRGPQLTAGPGAHLDWSIDGRAAFVRDGDLYVRERTGAERRLTFKGAANPSWSPRGRWIAFTRRDRLFVVAARGGSPARRLIRGTAKHPVWSPDGRKVAFLRQVADEEHLFVVRRRDRQVTRITAEPLTYYGTYLDVSISPPEWQPLPASG